MISFKTIEEKDQAFSEKVFRSTREKELDLTNWTEIQKEIFIKMQSMAQLADYKKNFVGATYQIINHKKKPAGRLFLWETDKEFRIIDIALLPDFQRKGIGRKILSDIITSAKQKKKMVTLHVTTDNPAKKLYESLGFKKISVNGYHEYMQWKTS